MTDTLEADVGDMLFGDLPSEETQTNDPVAEQPQAQEPEPQTEPEPAPQAEPVATEQPEEPKGAHHVPLAVLLDEREKRKEYERKLREYEEREA